MAKCNHGYDLVCSLGGSCGCAMLLNDVGLRLTSLPFDWITGASIETRVRTLCARFGDFLKRQNIAFRNVGRVDRANDVYHDVNLGYVFVHDFPKNKSLDESFPQVREKYDRRIARLLKCFDDGLCVCLVWRDMDATPSDELCQSALADLNRTFPKATFGLLVYENDATRSRHCLLSRTLAGGHCTKVRGNFAPEGVDDSLGDRALQRSVLRQIPLSRSLAHRCRANALKRSLVRFISLWHLTREGRKMARSRWTARLRGRGRDMDIHIREGIL